MATPLGMASAATLTDMQVDSGLVQKRWNDNKLYMESLQEDPLFNSDGIIKTIEVGAGKNKIAMPRDSFFVNCTPKDKKGTAARNIELVFLKSLDDDPVEGNSTNMVGSEATLDLKFTSVYANDWANAVAEDTYGIDYRELNVYGVYEQVRPLLGQWLGELRGMYARQAAITKISQNLTSAPVSLTAGLNPNWYFPGLAQASQPTYDSTLADFENAIGAASVTAQGSSNQLNIPRIITMLRNMRETKYIEQAKILGNPMYALFTASEQYDYLRDPSVTDSWGRYWRDVGSTEDLNMVMPATRMVVAEELAVCRDPRFVTMAVSGNASDYTLTMGYLKYGRKTTRTSETGNGYFDISLLFGAGGLMWYEPEAPHYENQPDNYRKDKGTGLFGGVGYNLPVWDLDSADQTDSTAQQESCAVIVTSRVA